MSFSGGTTHGHRGEKGGPMEGASNLYPLPTLFYTPYVVTPPALDPPPLETRTLPTCAHNTLFI